MKRTEKTFLPQRRGDAESIAVVYRRLRASAALRFILCIWALVVTPVAPALAAEPKPKVAVFPLRGSASAEQREKFGFSLRAKLDRDEHYDVIDGPTMIELAGDRSFDFSAELPPLQLLAKEAGAEVLIWGELNAAAGGMMLRLKTFDVNQPDPLPHEFEKVIAQPTDVRLAVEDILQTLEGVRWFEHPVEEALQDDEGARKLFEKNPNLVVNGDFAVEGGWEALLQSEIYPPALTDALPEADRVAIFRMPDEKAAGGVNNVLAMRLSKDVAENNGLACLSAPIPIQPDTRYRLSFRYRSDGPRLHVFVKGYTSGKNITGEPAPRECYRRQVPPSEATDGKWVTIVCDLNPQHALLRVENLRVDLYAYLQPGVVMFDDIQLKAVGGLTHRASDAAIKPPATRATKINP